MLLVVLLHKFAAPERHDHYTYVSKYFCTAGDDLPSCASDEDKKMVLAHDVISIAVAGDDDDTSVPVRVDSQLQST